MQIENKNWKKWLEIGAVVLVFALGAFVRLTHLTSFPPGLYPDEAMNTTDGLKTAEAGGWKLFYENNQGREGLYINILGYLLFWFGPSSLFIVRLLPALIGTLTLPAVYLLGRRFSGRFGGFMALFFMAFSFWHLNFSRVGFRAISMVLLTAWAFYFLVEGFYRLVYQRKGSLKCLKNKKDCDKTGKIPFLTYLFFALGGVFLGLSLHTYIAVRISPLAVFVLCLAVLIFFSNFWKDVVKALAVTGFFAFLTAFPLLYDFFLNPLHFSGRSSNVSVMSAPNVPLELGKSVSLTLISFLFYGDQNLRHNYPALPILPPTIGFILFGGIIFGLLYFLKEFFKRFFRKKEFNEEKNNLKKWQATAFLFLVSWWFFLLLPSMLTREGLPHSLRSIGSVVPTFLILGMVAGYLARRTPVRIAFLFLAITHALLNVYVYFFIWGKNVYTYGAFEHRLSGIGAYLNDEAEKNSKYNLYVIANQDAVRTDANLPVSMEPIRFFSWNFRNKINYVLPENFDFSKIKLPAKVVLTLDDPKIIDQGKKVFPKALFVRVKVGQPREDDPISFQDKLLYFGQNRTEGIFHSDIQTNSYFTYLEIEK